MIQKVLATYHLQALTCLGLLIFIGVFTGALVWVFRRGSVGFYNGLQSLPLQDLKVLEVNDHVRK